jgi:ABC-type multidrug transport system fused ATPase/permease subunit
MTVSATAPEVDRPRGQHLYAQLWHYARGARGMFVAAIALLTASQLVRLAVPWLAGRAIDVLQTGGPGASATAGQWVVALLATAIVVWALHGPGRVLEREVGVRVRRAVTDALVAKLARAPLAWHDRHTASDLAQRVSQASGALDDFTQNQYVVLQGVVTFVGTLVALVWFAPLAGVVAIVGYATLVVAGLRFDRTMMRLADEENEASRRFTSGLFAFTGSIVSVSALRMEASTRRRLRDRLEAIFVPLARSIRVNEAKWAFVDLTTTALTWGIVALDAWQAHRDRGAAGGAILLGGLFVVYKYAEQASGVVCGAAAHFQTFARFRVNFASADLILDAPERSEAAVAVDRGWRRIEVDGIAFRHAVVDGGGIEDVKLTLARGERIALVGPSGSGKSTLLRVLAGLYEPAAGTIRVDGVAHDAPRPLASISTFVPQDADAFEGSVLDNVAPEGASAALDTALDVSAFGDVVATLPGGLDAPIAERGINLSGGQRQRLALARGALAARDSSLLLLDEPTSALDPLTEARVLTRTGERFADACIVASVHRMGALAHFDRVVLMNDGRVVDSGTCAELALRQPLFAAMLGSAGDSDAALPRAA